MYHKINIIIFLILFSSQATGSELLINTLEEPPGSFIDDSGKLTGISVDVVKEIQRRVGNTDPIKVFPWARTYNNALTRPNVVAFTAARTKERENKFHWIAKIARSRYSFFIRKGDQISISTIDDAKKLSAVGVMRSSVWEQYLRTEGLTNLDLVATHELNVKKLLAKRIPAIYLNSFGLLRVCKKTKIECNKIYPIFSTKTVESYIIMSKNGTPVETVNQWVHAAQEIKKDGTYKRIALKWMNYLKFNDFESHFSEGALNLWAK